MKCQHCGKETADDSKHCQFCGKPVSQDTPVQEPTTQSTAAQATNAWYKKWWIWVIAAVVVAGIATACVFMFSCKSGDPVVEPKKIETTAGTAAQTTEKTTAATEPAKADYDKIIKEGFEKVGITAIYNSIDKYKGAKILTAVLVKDLGENAVYANLENDKKTVAFYKFVFDDKNEIKNVKKGEYVAVYGVVNPKGMTSGTIEVDECHVASLGDEAKGFFGTIKDEKIKVPSTTAAATTAAKTTAAATTAAGTTASPTTQPATEKPTDQPATTDPTETTQPTTKGYEKILYDDNKIVVKYKSFTDNEFYAGYFISVENKSGKDLYIGACDSKVNGKPLDLLICDLAENGKSIDTEMFILKSDLEEAGIVELQEITFKFIFDDPNDWDHPIKSKDITFNP